MFQDDVIACITYSNTREVKKLRMKVRQLEEFESGSGIKEQVVVSKRQVD